MGKAKKKSKFSGKPCLVDPLKKGGKLQTSEGQKQLLEALPGLLKEVFPPKANLKTVDTSFLSKEERKAKMTEMRADLQNKATRFHVKKNLAIGFSSCLRLLKSNQLLVLAFDEECEIVKVQPFLSSVECQLLRISGLSNVISRHCGFPSSTFGIKRHHSDDEQLLNFIEIVKAIKGEPKIIITEKDQETVKTREEPEKVIRIEKRKIVEDSKAGSEPPSKRLAEIQELHLTRSDSSYRAFKPPKPGEICDKVKRSTEEDSKADFLSFNISEEGDDEYCPTFMSLR